MKLPFFHILILLLVILIVGGSLRMINLGEQGLLFYDSANLAVEGKLLHAAIVSPEMFNYMKTRGFKLWYGRPFYNYMLTAVFLVAGVNSATILYLNSCIGLLTITLIYFCLARIGEQRLGIYAAAILAVCKWHVFYSRTGLAEIAPTFFILLGFYVYLTRGKNRRRLVLAGIFMGVAFICNQRVLFILFSFCLLPTLPVENKGKTLTVKLGRVFMFAGGMLIPVLIQQVVSMYVLVPAGITTESYFSQLEKLNRDYFPVNKPVFTFIKSHFYFRYYHLLEGNLPSALLITGILYLATRKRAIFLITALPVLVPLVFFSFYALEPTKGLYQRIPRSLSACLPFMAILAGAGLYFIETVLNRVLKTKGQPGNGMIMAILLVIIFTHGIYRNRDMMILKSGYLETNNYIISRLDSSYFSTNAPIAWFLMDKSIVNFPPVLLSDLVKVSKTANVAWLAVDYLYYRIPFPSLQYIIRKCQPVAIIDNPSAKSLPVLFEAFLNFDEVKAISMDPHISKIRIYNLPPCLHQGQPTGE